MKNKLLYISTLTILSVGLFYNGWHVFSTTPYVPDILVGIDRSKIDTQESNTITPVAGKEEVVRYGTIITNSSSGSSRLHYYDINEKKVLDSWQGYPSFWISIKDINDREGGVALSEYIRSNEGSLFRIEGIKDSDDCGYYGNGICLENIIIEKIGVVAK